MFGIPKTLLLGFALSALLFIGFADIDIWFSGLFYDAQQGFYLAQRPWAMFVYHGIRVLTVAMVVLLSAAILYNRIQRRALLGYTSRAYVYLLLVLIVGPGLLGSITKDHWHRARPATIEQFGGDRQFTPAFLISDQCDRNCSFISGHPTTLYFFYAVGLIAPLAYRRKVMAFAIVGGLLVGWVRVLQGGHFLSDVVSSGFVVIATAYLLYWLMFSRGGQSARLEPH